MEILASCSALSRARANTSLRARRWGWLSAGVCAINIDDGNGGEFFSWAVSFTHFSARGTTPDMVWVFPLPVTPRQNHFVQSCIVLLFNFDAVYTITEQCCVHAIEDCLNQRCPFRRVDFLLRIDIAALG